MDTPKASPPSPFPIRTPSAPSSPSPPQRTSPSPPPRSRSPLANAFSKIRDKIVIPDFDSLLGPLDPNRQACASAPQPHSAVVFGADTEAGCSVVRALLEARRWKLAALVVDDKCPATCELRNRGVRVVKVDMDNEESYETELRGADAVYLSSNVMALHAILVHQHEPQRTQFARSADACQLAKAVGACARAKVGHVVFRVDVAGSEIGEAGGPGIRANTRARLLEAGVPTTVLHTPMPFTRIPTWINPRNASDPEAGYILAAPVPDDTLIPAYAIEQTGGFVLAALKNPKHWVGKEMHAVPEFITPIQVAERLSAFSKRPVETAHLSKGTFESLEHRDMLGCKWAAWDLVVRGEYKPEHLASEQDVPDQWKLEEWMAVSDELHKALNMR